MVTSKAKTVPAYIKEVPAEKQATLKLLRQAIRKAAPSAKEGMVHGVPTYSVNGEVLFAFAAQKQYHAFHCCEVDVKKTFKERLGKVDCGKSCVRYRKPEDVDVKLIGDIVRAGLKVAKAKAKAAKS